jgi:hypothetical protein
MMNLPLDTPGTCFIQPALHTLSLEGLFCWLAVNDCCGRFHRQLDLPDNTGLIGLIPASGRLLLIIDRT